MRNSVKSVLIVFAVMAVTVVPFSESDALDEYDLEYNCNDYNLSFIYTGGTVGDITVEWSAYGVDADGRHFAVRQVGEPPSSNNNWKVRFDPDDVMLCKFVFITQKIDSSKGDSDEMTIKVNIITPPPAGGFFDVRFYDGYSGGLISVASVYGNKAVDIGENFVDPPGAPIREGYSFIGWFLPTDNPDVYIPFDPTDPVESDLDVYAKWAKTGDPGDIPDPTKKIVSLKVSGNYKTEYTVGDYLDITGMSVIATMADGTTMNVVSKCDFTPTKFNFIGPITVTVTYSNVETIFDVEVHGLPSDPDSGDGNGGNGGNGDEDGNSNSGVNMDSKILNYALIGLVIVVCGIVAYKFLGRGRA